MRTSRRLAPAPAKLLEAAKSKPVVEEFRRESSSTAAAGLDGPPIPDGGRNDSLARIAGRLHDGGRSLDQLDADLQAVNERRCQPPLDPREVSKVARSIHARTPCGAPGPAEEALEALRGCERELEAREWPRVGGKSDRDVYVALIKLARKRGSLIAAGVRVSVSIRALALEAGSSTRTIQKRLWSLRLAGLVRRDGGSAGKGTKAGSFVLVGRAKVPHSTTGGYAAPSVVPLRAPRLRWSAPGVLRLGKTCGAILDTLEARGGSATVEELADALHVSRVRDFKRRNIARLQERGIVNVFGDNVCLVEDWLGALDEERELSGEKDSLRRDEARYERERSAFKERRRIKRSHHPANFGADDWTDTLTKLREGEEAFRGDRRTGFEDSIAAEMRRPSSGPAKALETFLSKPNAERLKYLTIAVLRAQGRDTGLWKRHAGAVEEAAGAVEEAGDPRMRGCS